MIYVLLFVTRTAHDVLEISMRSFIRIRPVILGDMPWTYTHTQTHTATEGHSDKPWSHLTVMNVVDRSGG